MSSACYVEDALPAVIYLAWKYAHDPEAGLIANTHLGGTTPIAVPCWGPYSERTAGRMRFLQNG